MKELVIILAVISGAVSIISLKYLADILISELNARKTAKLRYEKEPELGVFVSDFYVPTITIGSFITFVLLWVVPGLNLITAVGYLIYICVQGIKRVWNNPLIDW